MTSKIWSPGTIIDSVWLQDVDNETYHEKVSSIALLRLLDKTKSSSQVSVSGYYIAGDGGGGRYYYDSADTTSADNGGTIIVASDGGRWKLIYSSYLSVKQFGAKGDSVTDDSAAFIACLLIGPAYAPSGTYKISIDLVTTNTLFGDGVRKTIFIPVAGSTYVLRCDATTVAKQFITLRNFSINNPNSVVNCYGIYLKGTTVANINDYHFWENLYIGQFGSGTGFLAGINVTGRMIWSTLINVECTLNTRGWDSATDASSSGFAAINYVGCRFAQNTNEGFRHTGQNVVVTFTGCTVEKNNSLQVAGVAGLKASDINDWSFNGLGLESNGDTVAVDGTTALNNSIGLYFTGTVCNNLHLKGVESAVSGCSIAIDATQVKGGKCELSNISSRAGGWGFAGISGAGAVELTQQFVFSANNLLSNAKVVFTQDVNGNYGFCIEQNLSQSYYLTAAVTVDFLRMCVFDANPGAGTIAITTLTNNIPGCQMVIMNNNGAGNVTVAAALMKTAALSTVAAGTAKRYRVLGGVNVGKLVEV